MADPIVFNGTVEWSGENPGISLKETPDGPFVVLASFFRVVLSPQGRGHVLVLLQSPHEANPRAERGNYCLHDNQALARYRNRLRLELRCLQGRRWSWRFGVPAARQRRGFRRSGQHI